MAREYVGQLHIFTFKQGLLSRMAHDLKLSVERFEGTRTGHEVRIVCWTDSIEVVGVVRGNGVNRSELSAEDKQTIQGNIQREVLQCHRFPTVSLAGVIDGNQLTGELALRGQTHRIRCPLTSEKERFQGRVELRPSRWGIKPFKALMGAIRLQDRVIVEFDLGPVQ